MKKITIKKSTYNLVETHANGVFAFAPEGTEFLDDTVLIEVSDELHKRLSSHIDTMTPSIDKVLVMLCTAMDHKGKQ